MRGAGWLLVAASVASGVREGAGVPSGEVTGYLSSVGQLAQLRALG